MQRFQTILLSLLVLVFLSLSEVAADETDSALNNTATADAELNTQTDDVIMMRQIQPVIGFQSLTVAGQDIHATFLEETLGEPYGAIVLFHDQGEELESRGVVTPLRHKLLQYGWSTLSLTLDYPFTPNILLAIDPEEDASNTVPAEAGEQISATEIKPSTDIELAEDEAIKDDSALLPSISNKQRVEAALAFLNAKDIKRIIFLGHGRGGIVAIKELSSATTPISALILIGTPALPSNDEFKTFEQPILDIYGDRDLQGVAAAVNDRKLVMKRNDNIRYTAREIIGANHAFYGLEPTLAASVRGWLRANFVKQEKSD